MQCSVKGLQLPELQAFVESLGEKKYRASQLFQWMYAKQAQQFDEMTDLSVAFREKLKQHAVLQNLELVVRSDSSDGTQKYLFALPDGLQIESVLIPPAADSPGAEKRLTLCVSTQVGCPLDCAFCATGSMGFARNLTAGEIIDQVLQTQRRTDRRISNVVFMGMGEPMLNYENVMKAIELLQDDHSLNIGIRHMTISTAGYADQIRRLADEDRNIKLALSLHTLNNELRLKLMPVTRKYSVEELLQALEYYYRRTRYRPTLEYILFDGLNDTEEDARALIEVGKRLPCKVNLIPYHAVDFARPAAAAGLTLRPSPPERIASFAAALRTGLMTVMVRNSSGNDIHAACGQLAVQHPSADKP